VTASTARVPVTTVGAPGMPRMAAALTIWDGQHTNVDAAQRAIQRRAKANRDARRGEYARTAVLAST